MIDQIITAVSNRLNELFIGDYEIYSQNVEQGLQEPCFFIRLVSAVNTALLKTRKQMSYTVMVTYFPTEDESNDELMLVGDKLVGGLEYINTLSADIVRGFDMSYEIDATQNVLHFTVTYKVFLNRETEFIPMVDLLRSTELNGD